MQVEFATTTMPTILLWVLGLAVFLIGGLIGYFNMNMDARKKLDTADQKIEAIRTEADLRIAEAKKMLDEAKALNAQAPKVVQQVVNEPSLLKLKSDDGLRVNIEMDGSPLTAPLTVDRKKRLIELLNHIRPWLEGATAAPQATPAPQVVSRPASQPLQTPPVSAPVPQPAPELKPVPVTLTLNPQKPKITPEQEFKLLSMVKQIDFVLQKRIAGTTLESMGIHLNDTLHGGLEVQIGSQKFETIDDVPDPNIQSAIRAAIVEWETKYIPGA